MAFGEDSITAMREVLARLVRRDAPLLTSHQLAVYLTCYLTPGDHTVRGLAADLNVSKSVITRALDRLGELELARRQIDPRDRRSIIVKATAEGMDLLTEMKRYAETTPHGEAAPPPPSHAIAQSALGSVERAEAM